MCRVCYYVSSWMCVWPCAFAEVENTTLNRKKWMPWILAGVGVLIMPVLRDLGSWFLHRPAPEVRAWIGSSRIPLDDVPSPTDGWSFLDPLLEGKRVVMIGENHHFTGQFSRYKASLTEYLIQRLGYRVVAFESPLLNCLIADSLLAQNRFEEALAIGPYPIWHTEAVADLFRSLADRDMMGDDVHIAGFDVQNFGDAQDPDIGKCLADLLKPFDDDLARKATDAIERHGPTLRRRFRTVDLRPGSDLDAARNEFESLLADFELRLVDDDATGPSPALVRRVLHSLIIDCNLLGTRSHHEYSQMRDEAMAVNLEFLAKELFPESKIVVWAHNTHIQRAGSKIRYTWIQRIVAPEASRSRKNLTELLTIPDDELYVIGPFMKSGRYGLEGIKVTRLPHSAPGSLESSLHTPGAAAVFLDLDAGRTGAVEVQHWLGSEIRFFNGGSRECWMRPGEQYDAVLLVEEVTPLQR